MADGNFNLDFQTALVGSIVTPSETNGNIEIDGEEVTVYSLPTAASNVQGGVKIGSGLAINDGVASVDWASPALTGTPTAPTAEAGTDTTQVATTAFVQTAVAEAGGVFELIALESFDPDDTEQVTTLGEAVVAVIEDNKIPIIYSGGSYLYLQSISDDNGETYYCFSSLYMNAGPPDNGGIWGYVFTYNSSQDEWNVAEVDVAIPANE